VGNGRPIRVFVSYHRGESDALIGRFVDRLQTAFGATHVFRDTSAMKGADAWLQRINSALADAKVVVVAIGPRWSEHRREVGTDWVRYELMMARANGCTVLPVLLDGAVMPSRGELDGIEWLNDLQALDLRTKDQDFRADVEQIVERIRELDGKSKRWARVLALGGALAVVAIAVSLFTVLSQRGGGDDSADTTTAAQSTASAIGSSDPADSTVVIDDRLVVDGFLREGQERRSQNGRHVLTMNDGVLQLMTDGVVVWTTMDDRPGAQEHVVPGSYAVMQGDGNLVVHPPDGATDVPDPLWDMKTAEHRDAFVIVREAEDGSGYIAVVDVDGAEVGRRPPVPSPTPVPRPTSSPASTAAPTDADTTAVDCPVPNVVGLSQEAARSSLEADPCRAEIHIVLKSSPDVAAGLVIRTDPAPGERIPVRGTITVEVSDGRVVVCDVVGMTESQARTACRGLVVSITIQDLPPGSSSNGRVVAQSLTSGSRVEQQTRITLTIGRVPPPPSTT
jgi:hypothetical protein